MNIQEYLEDQNIKYEDCVSIKFLKTHPDAVMPVRKHDDLSTGDTGYDITAVEDVTLLPGESKVVPTGITLADMPPGIWMRIESRSSLAFKNDVYAFNGIIDNNYRGDLGVKLANRSDKVYYVKKGDRVAQLVLYPLVVVLRSEWASEITETDRGAGGFGSTGR